MVDKDYKRARDKAVKELEQALATQKLTEQRIVHLRNTIAALDSLAGVYAVKKPQVPKLTDAIRSIFKAAKANEWFSARDIRSGLLAMGFQEDAYSNLPATIHVVLRRLEKNRELESENHRFKRVPEVPEDFLKDL